MYKVISISLKDEKLIQAVERFKESGGNISGLVCKLLWHYFFGENNHEEVSKEELFLLDVKAKIEEFEKWKNEVMPKIQELEQQLKAKAEKREEDERLIEKLKKESFQDVADPKKWFEEAEIDAKRFGKRPEDFIKARLRSFANENNLSYLQPVKLLKISFAFSSAWNIRRRLRKSYKS